MATLYVVVGLYTLVVPVGVGVAILLSNARDVSPWMAAGLLGGAVVALSVATGLLLRQRLIAPLREVVRRLDRVTQGDFAGRLEVEREDEMGALKQAVNEMAAYLLIADQARVDRQYLQRVIDSMPDSLAVLDANGVVELCNARLVRALGYRGSSEVLGQSMESLGGGAATRWFQSVQRGRGLVHEAITLNGAAGRPVQMDVSAVSLERHEDETASVVMVGRDMHEVAHLTHELEQASARLAEQESFFQNLFDAMADPITVISPDLEITQANRAARAVFGRDMVGRRCFRAFRMRDSACEDCPAAATLATRKSSSVEHRVFGNAITRISTYPLFGKNGELRAIINHKRDVTKERQLEDLKAHFLAAVSHELRTPLTSLLGFNKLNMRRISRVIGPALADAPEKVQTALSRVVDDMEVMNAEGERLGRLVNDVLDLSKLEAGKLKLVMAEVDAVTLVRGAVAATSALWRAKGLTVEVEVSPETPRAWGDADRLSQVLVNLLSNAIKFTDEGRIDVWVRADDADVRFSVRDSGRGIPPDELGTVFEKFRQAGEGEANRPHGTGLGLPICKELIRLHEGRIGVESVVGAGSTFYFSIPRADLIDADQRGVRAGPSLAGF